MRRGEDGFKAQPIVMAAIASHGLDVDDLPWRECEQAAGEEVDVNGTRDLPSLHLHSDGGANIRWFRGSQGSLSFTLESDGYAIVTLEGLETPETMLAAMAGRPLESVVDMPGAQGMRIIEAVNSRGFVSDPLDTRISVTPQGMEAVDPGDARRFFRQDD